MLVEATEREACRVATWVEPAGPHSAKEMRKRSRSPIYGVAERLSAATVLGFGAILLAHGWLSFSVIKVAFYVTIALLLLAVWLFLNPKKNVTDEERALLAPFEPENGWIVEISVLQERTITGRDRGILWFEDGKLNFAGAHTSFAIGRADIIKLEDPEPRTLGLLGPITLPLKCPETKELWLSITPFDVDGSRLRRQFCSIGPKVESLQQTIARQLRSSALENIHGQLPPLVDGPNRPTIAHLVGWYLIGNRHWFLMIVNIGFVMEKMSSYYVPWSLCLLAFLIPANLVRLQAIVSRLKRDRRGR